MAAPPRVARRTSAILASVVLVTAFPTVAGAGHGHPNPAPYVALTAAAGAGRIVPLINSGQTFDGDIFEGIPDGLGLVPVGNGSTQMDLYVAFEQSHVPFSGFADFEDSSVHRARIDFTDPNHIQLVDLDEVLPPSAGFIRFCSAFMAGPQHGFTDYTFFVNEESNDIIDLVPGATYGADPAIAPYRQAGYSVWLNTATGAFDEISRMGRHNHENTVVVPGGWKWTSTLSSDDTFNAPSSQLYLHTANDPGQIYTDKGQLWAFQVTATGSGPVDPFDPFNGANDFLDIAIGQTWSGRFIHVPTDIARGVTDEAPQAALENWSNANNVFQFIRVEDIAYDPDDPRTVYFTDTGATAQHSTATEGPTAGRMVAGGVNNQGRIFKMTLNAADPRIVDTFSVLADASSVLDPASPGPVQTMRRPDNLDVGHASMMVQEDQSGGAKVWRYDLASGVWSHVATATQSTAETSGIIDLSSTGLGAGWWALDVQSHVNLPGTMGPFVYTTPITGVQITYNTRREDGQLLLMFIPGS
jgi:hypothetical protein